MPDDRTQLDRDFLDVIARFGEVVEGGGVPARAAIAELAKTIKDQAAHVCGRIEADTRLPRQVRKPMAAGYREAADNAVTMLETVAGTQGIAYRDALAGKDK